MVLLTERSREIADLTQKLTRAKTESLRHLEDAQTTARQLKRVKERVSELTQSRQALQTEFSKLGDDLENSKWLLASTRETAAEAEVKAVAANTELARLRQEFDATRRTLEAQSGSWEQEREQLRMTLAGLSLEIQNEHLAARVLERRWLLADPQRVSFSAEASHTMNGSGDPGPVDYRLAKTQALEAELESLREERAQLSARLRESERDAGAAADLERMQQDLRNLQVERKLLERKLEDMQSRDQERESLRDAVKELKSQLRETDGLRAEVERLRTKLYKAPMNSGTYPVGSHIEAIGAGLSFPRDLNSELAEFAQHADAQSAVVADGLGFPVAAFGEGHRCDGLAAVGGDADRLRTQARQILGLSEVTHLTIEDREGLVASFRYFAVDETLLNVGTLGNRAPVPEELERFVGITRRALTISQPRADCNSDSAELGEVRGKSRASDTRAVVGEHNGRKAQVR